MKSKFIGTVILTIHLLTLASCSTFSRDYGTRWAQPNESQEVKSTCAQSKGAGQEHIQIRHPGVTIDIDGLTGSNAALFGPPLIPVMAMEPPMCRMKFDVTITAQDSPVTIDFTQWELRPPIGDSLKPCHLKHDDTQLSPDTVSLKPGEKLTVELRFPRDPRLDSALSFVIRGIQIQSKPLGDITVPFSIESSTHYCPLNFFCSYRREEILNCKATSH